MWRNARNRRARNGEMEMGIFLVPFWKRESKRTENSSDSLLQKASK